MAKGKRGDPSTSWVPSAPGSFGRRLPGLLLPLSLLLAMAGCSAQQEDVVTRYVVRDQPTGKALSSYEYLKDTTTRLRASTFDAQTTKAKTITDYEYDAKGDLKRTTRQVAGTAAGTPKVTNYAVERVYDGSGRLTKTVQTGDDGTVVETYYGYDETGTLRGVVQKAAGDDSLLMKDY